MKKALAFILALTLCLGLCACGGSEEKGTTSTTATEVLTENKLGDTVETDILRITLTKAQLAIKLNASSSGTLSQIQSGQTTLSDQYFTPEEYDPKTDAGLAYVAAKGHTYVAIEFKAENLDRASVEFDGSFNDQFITVEYDGNKYKEKTNYGCKSSNGYEWVRYNSGNILLLAGEANYYRGYIDIPVDANDLNDDFTLIFSLPNSKESATKFKFVVKTADRASVEAQEISVGEAIHLFTQEDGQNYFKEHMNEYIALNGQEIESVIKGRKWNILIKKSYGKWEGAFRFDEDGRIQETIPMVGTGYYNDRSWKIKDNMLILDETDECQVLKIEESAYLLVMDNAPYAIMN